MPKISIIWIGNRKYAVVSWEKDGTCHCKISPQKGSIEEGEKVYLGHVFDWKFNHVDGYLKENGKIRKIETLGLDDFEVTGMPIQRIIDSGSGIKVPPKAYVGIYGDNLPNVKYISGVVQASGISDDVVGGSIWLARYDNCV